MVTNTVASSKPRSKISARRRANLRCRGILSIHPEEHRRHLDDLPRCVVYNDLPAIAIDTNSKLTMETCRQSEILFKRLQLKGYKRADKLRYWQYLVHHAKRAHYHGGCLMVPRHPDRTSRAHLQVIDAAVKANLLASYRSPPGSPKMSRLVPLAELAEITSLDPWDFDPNTTVRYVFLRKRRDGKEEIPFDPHAPLPARIQQRLGVLNAVNSDWEITFEPYDVWEDIFSFRRQLRPIHYAVFTDTFDLHGRLYTGHYGHQGLRKFERQTIRFDGEPCVELDYGGMHPRMLYHLEGIDFDGDPYELWGPDWVGQPKIKKPLRLMAKVMVNAAINARNRDGAISACNQAMRHKTDGGQWKQGKSLADARRLFDAQRKTGVRFAEAYDLALKHHAAISHLFGCDMGMKLMRIDSTIALDILYHFSRRGIPCLGCHDSFIVPERHRDELCKMMEKQYRRRLSFLPIID